MNAECRVYRRILLKEYDRGVFLHENHKKVDTFPVLERGVNREGGLLRRMLNKAFTVFRMEAQIVNHFVMALLGEFPCVSMCLNSMEYAVLLAWILFTIQWKSYESRPRQMHCESTGKRQVEISKCRSN